MDERRTAQIARNESRFREINERLNAGLQQVPDNPELLEFICECGNSACQEHVRLTLVEYERVRADSRRFAVVPGHVIPEAERVVASGDRFEVVEKHGVGVELADEADARAEGTTGHRDVRP